MWFDLSYSIDKGTLLNRNKAVTTIQVIVMQKDAEKVMEIHSIMMNVQRTSNLLGKTYFNFKEIVFENELQAMGFIKIIEKSFDEIE